MSSTPRIAAIDRMRGLVMILMASDHAAHVFYRDHMILDSAFFPEWSEPLPTIPFLHRWLSHVCAPVFVFLAGTSIALAASRRGASGMAGFDRDLLLRGLLLIGIDLSFISLVWGPMVEASIFLQVLYAIGLGMIAMIWLRRLAPRTLLILGLALAIGNEAITAVVPNATLTRLLWLPGPGGIEFVAYPAIPWFAAMLLGHAFGSRLAAGRDALRPLAIGSALALATWITVKLCDGYGNMAMVGVHDGPLRWLQVSKYPPSLAYFGLELGIGLALLAGFFVLDRRARRPAPPDSLLLVLGQTALFFYVLHIALIEAVGATLGDVRGNVARNWLAVIVTVAVLWPAGIWFRALRRRHPQSLLRLI